MQLHFESEKLRLTPYTAKEKLRLLPHVYYALSFRLLPLERDKMQMFTGY